MEYWRWRLLFRTMTPSKKPDSEALFNHIKANDADKRRVQQHSRRSISWVILFWFGCIFSSDFSRIYITHSWLLLLLGYLFSYFNFSGKCLDEFCYNFADMFTILLLNCSQRLNKFEIVVWVIFAFLSP